MKKEEGRQELIFQMICQCGDIEEYYMEEETYELTKISCRSCNSTLFFQ